jgi:hypothetical protein
MDRLAHVHSLLLLASIWSELVRGEGPSVSTGLLLEPLEPVRRWAARAASMSSPYVASPYHAES